MRASLHLFARMCRSREDEWDTTPLPPSSRRDESTRYHGRDSSRSLAGTGTGTGTYRSSLASGWGASDTPLPEASMPRCATGACAHALTYAAKKARNGEEESL